MRVTVKQELSQLTDGRERFAGQEGEVKRAPAGRIDSDESSPTFGEHFEHMFEVWFADGDHANFLSSELEGDEVPEFRLLGAAASEGGSSRSTPGAISEAAMVQELPEERAWPTQPPPPAD